MVLTSASKPVGNGKWSKDHWFPMDLLRRLAGRDVNELGQVDLVGTAVVAENKVEHVEDRRVGPRGWRALGSGR